ncbi:CDP-alcohol phosphatidyltransferase family protein [bacterium]|nr:CDP-alcohol phosphatidyltransferase family protein [bacterium]
MTDTTARRPLRTRQTRLARAAAARLARAGVAPNAISLASVVFAACAALALVLHSRAPIAARAGLLIAAALSIQLRLLCNLLDGMVAIEGGRATPTGEVFNDAPDRLADAVVLVAAGYSLPGDAWGRDLGWAAALLAVGTAYVRVLGTSLGLRPDFSGPLAKPHRMAVMTAACLVAALEAALASEGRAITVALVVVAAGSALTIARRLTGIVRALRARAGATGGPR